MSKHNSKQNYEVIIANLLKPLVEDAVPYKNK